MKNLCENKRASVATRLAVLGVLTALLEAVKWALNVLPNVELVTLFCALYGFCFGPVSVVAGAGILYSLSAYLPYLCAV